MQVNQAKNYPNESALEIKNKPKGELCEYLMWQHASLCHSVIYAQH